MYSLSKDDTRISKRLKLPSENTKTVDDQSIDDYITVKTAPPKRFMKRSDKAPDELLSESSAMRAVVSFQSPHTILSVSDTLVEWLGYNTHELVGRSLKVLSGPRTNMLSMHAAIKTAACIEAIIYANDGSGFDVLVSCSHVDGTIPGCSLEISQLIRDPPEPRLDDTSLSPSFSASAAHRMYNYRIGLALHAESAAVAASPNAASPHIIGEALLDALLAAP